MNITVQLSHLLERKPRLAIANQEMKSRGLTYLATAMNPTCSNVCSVLGALSTVHDHTRELVAASVFGCYMGAAPSLEVDSCQIHTDWSADLRS